MTSDPASRERLLSILEHFHLCPAAFDALRSDTYEKNVAARSLHELERLYTTLLNPALGYAQMQTLCPRWQGGRQNGRQPSLQTLCDIKQRLLAEHTVNDLGRMEKLLTSLRHRSSVLSKELQAEMFNAIVAMLGEELVAAKLDGTPIMENLRVVNRLLKVAALRLREQQGEARLKLQERRAERQAHRPPSTPDHPSPESHPSHGSHGSPSPAAEPSPSAQATAEKDESPKPRPLTPREKTNWLIERVYGIKLDEPTPKTPNSPPPQSN